MNNLTGNFSEDTSKYIVTVPALHTTAAGARITLPPVMFVFDTDSSTTPADVASALQEYVDKYSPVPADHAVYLCLWLSRNTNLEEGITSAFERALENDNGHNSLGGFVATATLNSDPDHKLVNELRLEWARHCITALHSLPSLRSKEMNEKHNYNLLRPVIFDDLKIGEVLQAYSGLPPTVAYKAPTFAVLKFEDGSEGCYEIYKLETSYKLVPLCWVEDKPVYPGDGPLYYKHDPAWVYNEEGVFALSIRGDELHFHGGKAFPISDATWTKPEPERVPSFQVEGQDVYPGDTVYYYGTNKASWGEPHTVKENRQVIWQCTGRVTNLSSLDKEEASFRLKPMLVIGDQLVPMPVRDAAEMKKGDNYYTPCLDSDIGYLSYTWSNHSFDIEMCDKGLVHRTKEAASAHTGAFIAISKKKD